MPGGVFGDAAKTVDGFQKTFQINHLARSSSTDARLSGKIDIDDLNQGRDYGAIRAYGTSKLENILFTQELHRRYSDEGISAAAFHPGNVASSFGNQTKSRDSRLARQLWEVSEKLLGMTHG